MSSSSTTSSPSKPGPVAAWWERSRQQMRQRPVITLVVLGLFLAAAGAAAYFFGYLHFVGKRHWDKAQKALAVDDFDTAIPELKLCTEYWSNDGKAHFTLAQTLRRDQKFADASAALQRAEQLGYQQEEIDLEHLLTSIQMEGPRATGLQTVLPMFQSRFAEEPLVLEAVVKGYHRHQALRETMHWLTHWTKNYPDDWRGWYLRAEYFYVSGIMGNASENYEQALKWSPDHPRVRLQLGLCLVRLGRETGRAVRLFEEQLDITPDSAHALVGLARCQRALGNYAAARSTLERLLQKSKNDPSGLLTLALVESDDDKPQKALVALERLKDLQIRDVEDIYTFVNLCAGVHRRLEQTQQAERYESRLKQLKDDLAELNAANEALVKGSTEVALRRKVGMIYMRLGLEDIGAPWLIGVLRENENDPPVHAMLADFYAKRNDPNSQYQASEHRKRANALKPGN